MRTRTPVLILVIGLLLGGIIALNVAMKPISPDEPAQQEQAQEQSADAPAPDAGALAGLPPDTTFGPANAKNKVVVGWAWTPEVQADPSKVYGAISALRAAMPDASIRVVNNDVHPDAPRGVHVNGRKIMDLPPDGSLDPSGTVTAVAMTVERQPPATPGS